MFNIKNCITRLFFIFVILRSIKVRDSSVIGVYEAEEDIQEIHVLQFLSSYLRQSCSLCQSKYTLFRALKLVVYLALMKSFDFFPD